MQTDINDTFLFSCKWFTPASNEKVHNFLSYLNFFIAYAWLLWLFYWLSYRKFMKTSLASCDSKFGPWLGNCLFWVAYQNISKSGKALDWWRRTLRYLLFLVLGKEYEASYEGKNFQEKFISNLLNTKSRGLRPFAELVLEKIYDQYEFERCNSKSSEQRPAIVKF